jgi:hypothetical protein
MVCALNVIQKHDFNPDISISKGTATAAAHLMAYLKTLKLQKIFRFA